MKNTNEIVRKIKKYKLLNTIIWLINIVLIAIPFVQFYNNNKIVIDIYFILISILNIGTFYLTYLINDKLSFYKYQFDYFSKKENQN